MFHGFVRFGENYSSFVEGVSRGFEGTIIPAPVARLFAMTFPPLEFAIGLLLVFGLFTRWAAFAGALTIALFTVGKCLQQDWQVVALQLIYAIAFYLLLVGIERNRFSLDSLRKPKM
jgi:thiosulfate dehydrogenase [quinone] large subunit